MSEENAKPGIVRIHGKDYKTVAYRLGEFREKHPHWAIETKIISNSEDEVVIKASISNATGAIKASGIAHEMKEHTNNRTI